MPAAPAGLHHATAIATEPQVNADFYHTVLGLRLVKTTVNFDDPGTYHLYYGNGSVQPGRLITFFPWPRAAGAMVHVICSPEAPQGLISAGTVHHIAWRSPGDAEQVAWRDTLLGKGLNVTPVIDRQYFHSIYFRKPSGVLPEIATDPSGFAIDEPLVQPGRSLKLPPWLEPTRDQIEHALPALKVTGPGEEIIMPSPPHTATT